MDHACDTDEFAAIRGVQSGQQRVPARRIRLVSVARRRAFIGRDQPLLRKLLQDVARGIGRDKQCMCHFVDGSRLRAVIPQQQQSFEMGDAVDVIANEAVDVDCAVPIFVFHS